MTILRMYTDGGCSGNQSSENAGGWGTILEFGEHRKEMYGGAANTTNNRMELTAVIEGFRALNRDGQTVEVFSDSAYVSNCFREKWYESWEKNKWRNAAKKSVENQDLWKELLELVRRHDVRFYRVKGHVRLDSKSTDFDKLYEKFVSWNGTRFSFDDFRYVTAMNNRADELANMGINKVKGE
ncbi:MAG: RNase H family protein [Emergencia sp.]